MTNLRQQYEETPYPDGIFPQTHPSYLGALATLFGLSPVPPASAKVLELGCAYGSNLMMMADDLPDADLLGIDFAQVHIDSGRKKITEKSYKNIELIEANILDYDFGQNRFDYIIAHGVFSWVADEVKERLLTICQQHLTPNGLAYISYNTYPGWSYREGLRELLSHEMNGAKTRQEQEKRLNRFVGLFEYFTRHSTDKPHSSLLMIELDILKGKAEHDFSSLWHDDLELVNDPCYFTQFIEWTSEFDLAYIADANYEHRFPEQLSATLKKSLDSMDNGLLAEQYIDFFTHRHFRASILCKNNQKPLATPDPLALYSLYFRSNTEKNSSQKITHSMAKKCLKYLNKKGQSFTSFEDIYVHGFKGGIVQLDVEDDLKDKIGLALLYLFGKKWIDISL